MLAHVMVRFGAQDCSCCWVAACPQPLCDRPLLPVTLLCRVSMSAAAPALQFVLATYDINGTWLGLQNWTLQLQACGGNAREAALWTRWV